MQADFVRSHLNSGGLQDHVTDGNIRSLAVSNLVTLLALLRSSSVMIACESHIVSKQNRLSPLYCTSMLLSFCVVCKLDAK